MTTTDNAAAIEVLARRRLELTHQLDELKHAVAQVDAALMTMLQPGDHADIDGQPVWTIRAGNARFNEAKARDVLPQELVEAATVTETHLSKDRAREILPPALYAECCVAGRPFVAKASSK